MNNVLVKMSIFLCVVMMIDGESFVVSPKQKTPSSNVLKESCGQAFSAIFDVVSPLLRTLADLHELVVCRSYDLLTSSKKGFFARASKNQVQEYHDELVALEQDLEDLKARLAQRVQRLQRLEQQVM
jgi:hypothetical protein